MTRTRLIAMTLAGAALLAAVQTRLLSATIPAPDAIAYFEIADQIRSVGYTASLAQHWSPLYPLWLAGVKALWTTAIDRELTVTAVSDAVLLFAWCGLTAWVYACLVPLWNDDEDGATAWLAYVLGVTVLLAFAVLRVGLRMPDVLVAILAMLVLAAWIASIRRELSPAFAGVAGVASGAAFLARANLLHWSMVVAAAAVLLAPFAAPRRRVVAGAACLAGLLMVAGPQTWFMSSAQGHFTFGESGKTVFAETYGAEWPNGAPAWPARASGGDVRFFTGARAVNFPGFYDPSREYADASVQFSVLKAVRGVGRSLLSLMFGYWTPGFALGWIVLWVAWPILLFAWPVPAWTRATFSRRDLPSSNRDRTDAERGAIGWLLLAAGVTGVAMHLASFAIGYYLPAYLVPLYAGGWLLVLGGRAEPHVREFSRRAAWIVAAGCIAMTVLVTARYTRDSDRRARSLGLAAANALPQALVDYPATDGSLRRIAVAGRWLGEYGIRLAGAEVAADVPDLGALRDPGRRAGVIAALRAERIVALLVPDAVVMTEDQQTSHVVGTSWQIVDLRCSPGCAR